MHADCHQYMLPLHACTHAPCWPHPRRTSCVRPTSMCTAFRALTVSVALGNSDRTRSAAAGGLPPEPPGRPDVLGAPLL